MKIVIFLMFLFPYAFAQKYLVEGNILIKEFNTAASFSLLNKGDDSFLEIKLKDSESSCYFKVRDIYIPQKLNFHKGYIWTNKYEKCSPGLNSKIISDFISSIELIDLSFILNSNNKLVGTALMYSENKDYRFDLKFN